MSKKVNVVDVASDVPFSVPSRVDVIVDLPPKGFVIKPKVVAGVVVGVAAAGIFIALKARHDSKKKANGEEFDPEEDAKANAELDSMTLPKRKPTEIVEETTEAV